MKSIVAAVIMLESAAFSLAGAADNSSSDFEFIIKHLNENRYEIAAPPKQDFAPPSDPALLAAGLIRFYQIAISSQDMSVCNFSPSCSRFTLAAIRDAGLIKGSLLSGDRLMRCHWFSRGQGADAGAQNYNLNFSHKIFDPLEKYQSPGK